MAAPTSTLCSGACLTSESLAELKSGLVRYLFYPIVDVNCIHITM
jgi:hypothetical protein